MLSDSLLFENVAERYINYILKPRLNDQAREIKYTRYWIEQFKGMNIAEIERHHVALARDSLLLSKQTTEGRMTGTVAVNRSISRLKHFFNVCAYEWSIIGHSPAKGLKPYKETKVKVVFLTTAEIIKLLDECAKSHNKDLYLAVLMLVVSGARKNEVMTLTFEQLNYEDMSASLLKQKNGNAGKLIFNEEVIRLLKDKDKAKGDVFKHKAIDKGFKAAAKRAGIEKFSIHGLRHTFASHLAINNMSDARLMTALRVSSPQVVRKYAHIAPSTVTTAVRNISANWKVSPEQRGWIFEEGETKCFKYPNLTGE